MTPVSNPFLFGLPAPVYYTPLGASFGVSAAPLAFIGAELLAVRDAYVEVDPEEGNTFAGLVAKYRELIGGGSQKDLQEVRAGLFESVKTMNPEKWMVVVQKVEALCWPTMPGMFATRPLFQPPQLSEDDAASLFTQWGWKKLGEQVQEILSLQRELLGKLAQGEWPLALHIMNFLDGRITELVSFFKMSSPSFESGNQFVLGHNISEFRSWLFRFLEMQYLIMDHFKFISRTQLSQQIRFSLFEAVSHERSGRLFQAGEAYIRVADGEWLFAMAEGSGEQPWEKAQQAEHLEMAGVYLQRAALLYLQMEAPRRAFDFFCKSAMVLGIASEVHVLAGDYIALLKTLSLSENAIEKLQALEKSREDREGILGVLETYLGILQKIEENADPENKKFLRIVLELKRKNLAKQAKLLEVLGKSREAIQSYQSAIEVGWKRIPFLMENRNFSEFQGLNFNNIKYFRKISSLCENEGELPLALAVQVRILLSLLDFMDFENKHLGVGVFKDQPSLASFVQEVLEEAQVVFQKGQRGEVIEKAIRWSGTLRLFPEQEANHPLLIFFQNLFVISYLLRKQGLLFSQAGETRVGEKINQLLSELEWFEKPWREWTRDPTRGLEKVIDLRIGTEGNEVIYRDKNGTELTRFVLE